jgi:N-acetylglucosaminyldiphosphoundecaprenol N-acetyl-beta-D-mannosaminyltransferase
MKIKEIIDQIKSISFKEVLEYISEKAKQKEKKTFIVTINPEIVMLAKNDAEYEKVLRSADLCVADGVGIVLAGKVFGKSFKGRIHGADLVEKLPKHIAKKPITVGFLGGQGNVAQTASNCLKEKYPELKVAFAVNEPSEINKIQADILFVAFGSPKQEKWIYENLQKIDVNVAIGVGGAFDFVSGKVPRAPKFIRSLGLEWLFRLIIQPWRVKRQLALIKFVFLVLLDRVKQ